MSTTSTRIVGTAPDLERVFPGQSYLSAWENVNSYAKHIENIKSPWHAGGWDNDADFTGTKDMGEALTLAKDGWKEGAQMVSRVRDRILANRPLQKQLQEYGIAGASPDVPRAISGNPMNMRIPKQNPAKKKPVITFVSDMSACCGVNKEIIANRAAVVAAIVDYVENAGFSCEVLAASFTRRKNYKVVSVVRAKEPNHPVDTMRLAFTLGHPSMFRRLMFADWGGEPSTQVLGGGLGHVHRPDIKHLNEMDMYVLPSPDQFGKHFVTEEKSADEGVTFMVDYLSKQKCPAFWKRGDPVIEYPPEVEKEPFDFDW